MWVWKWIWELGVGMGVSVYGTGDGRRETETGEYLFKGRRERVGWIKRTDQWLEVPGLACGLVVGCLRPIIN